MQININKDKKEFKPFDINIKVESVEELAYLWCCFNVSDSEIMNKAIRSSIGIKNIFSNADIFEYYKMELFRSIDNELRGNLN